MASKSWRALESKSITSLISVPKVSQKHKLISLWKLFLDSQNARVAPNLALTAMNIFEIALLALTAY